MRYTETQPVFEVTANNVANFFIHQIVLQHGAPNPLLSDRGTPSLSQVTKEVLHLARTIHRVTCNYHPQKNGLTERLILTLADIMSMSVTEDHIK